MTEQDSNIERSDSERKNKPIRHANNLFVLGMSLIGFCLDGYQPSDVFFLIGIVIWLWTTEFEVLESLVFSKANFRRLLFIVSVSLMVVLGYVLLGIIFSTLTKFVPAPLAWVFFVSAAIAVASLFYNAIHYLAVNNPVGNIGKETNEVHRCFMIDHKEHKGVWRE